MNLGENLLVFHFLEEETHLQSGENVSNLSNIFAFFEVYAGQYVQNANQSI